MIEFLDSILGIYDPVTYFIDNQEVIAYGFAGVDWPYLVRACVFLVVLYVVLRTIGGMLCRM